MHGQVLGIDPVTNEGQISGADGGRYAFGPGDWRLPIPPQPGQLVDFEPSNGCAREIFAAQNVVPAHANVPGEKNKVAAGLFAIFLGSLGAHKFYLGYTGAGVILLSAYLGCMVLGFLLLFTIILAPISFLLFMVPGAVHLVAVIDGIIYLTMPDAQFEATYVRGRKEWF